jgi:hypothetical protein
MKLPRLSLRDLFWLVLVAVGLPQSWADELPEMRIGDTVQVTTEEGRILKGVVVSSEEAVIGLRAEEGRTWLVPKGMILESTILARAKIEVAATRANVASSCSTIASGCTRRPRFHCWRRR